MKFVTDRFARRDLIFLAVAAGLVLLYVLKANGGFPLDDSWIHQVYGRNLAQTGQWAYIAGVPSAASTSPLYTVLLSIGYRLNIPFKVWTEGLGILTLWYAGVVGARMAVRLLPDQKLIGGMVGLLIMLDWHLIWAAASGMETMLFAMWTLVLIALGWHEANAETRSPGDEVRRGAIFGALSALATLTRPEGIVLVGLIGLTMTVLRPQRSWRGFLQWGSSAAIAFVVVLVPYLVFNLRLTGGLLPDTAAAKQAEAADFLAQSYFVRLKDMLLPLFAGALVFLLPGIVYTAVMIVRRVGRERARLLDLLPLAWAAALVALYAARLPANYQHGRYVMPALPSLIVPGMVGTIALVKWGRTSPVRRVLTRSLAIATTLAFIVFALFIGPTQYAQDVGIVDQEMVTSAHWIADHIPSQELLAVHDIGAVGYFAPRPILDLAGLVSPEIVPFIKDANRVWDWLQQHGARFLMAFPDQIPGGHVDDPRLCPVFSSGGTAAQAIGGSNMTIYELAWDGNCHKN
jgi:hypothetical protein